MEINPDNDGKASIVKAIIFFSFTTKISMFVFRILKWILKWLSASYCIISLKKSQVVQNTLRTPSEMGDSKFDQKWRGMSRVSITLWDFFKKSALQEKTFKNRYG